MMVLPMCFSGRDVEPGTVGVADSGLGVTRLAREGILWAETTPGRGPTVGVPGRTWGLHMHEKVRNYIMPKVIKAARRVLIVAVEFVFYVVGLALPARMTSTLMMIL